MLKVTQKRCLRKSKSVHIAVFYWANTHMNTSRSRHICVEPWCWDKT